MHHVEYPKNDKKRKQAYLEHSITSAL